MKTLSNHIIYGVVLSVILIAPAALKAQDNWSFELRPSVNIPTGESGDLNAGPGIEGTFHYRIHSSWGVYAGWGWNHFSSDQPEDTDFEETGYTLGVQYTNSPGTGNLAWYARGGVVFNHIEVENKEGDMTADSGHGAGWQLESGVVIPLGQRWQILPGIRYHSLTRDLEINGTGSDFELNYLSAGVGIKLIF